MSLYSSLCPGTAGTDTLLLYFCLANTKIVGLLDFKQTKINQSPSDQDAMQHTESILSQAFRVPVIYHGPNFYILHSVKQDLADFRIAASGVRLIFWAYYILSWNSLYCLYYVVSGLIFPQYFNYLGLRVSWTGFVFDSSKYSQNFCSHTSYILLGTVLTLWSERLACRFPPVLEIRYTLVSVIMLTLGSVGIETWILELGIQWTQDCLSPEWSLIEDPVPFWHSSATFLSRLCGCSLFS